MKPAGILDAAGRAAGILLTYAPRLLAIPSRSHGFYLIYCSVLAMHVTRRTFTLLARRRPMG